jgi:hypothetical protein
VFSFHLFQQLMHSLHPSSTTSSNGSP